MHMIQFIVLKTVLHVKCDYYVFYKHTTNYLYLFKKLNSLSNQLVQLIIDTDSTDTLYTVYILNVYQVLLCSYFFIQILIFIPIFFFFFFLHNHHVLTINSPYSPGPSPLHCTPCYYTVCYIYIVLYLVVLYIFSLYSIH